MESLRHSGVLYIANMYSVLALDLSKLEVNGSTTADGGVAAATAAAPVKNGITVEQLQKSLLGDMAKPLNCAHCGLWNVKKSSYCGRCK
jgi:hypothetical protein